VPSDHDPRGAVCARNIAAFRPGRHIRNVMRSGGSDCIVVGAGLIGLSTAVHLAWQGLDVRVIERGRIGDGTSSKASGWISAQLRTPNPLLELVLDSQAYYPDFLARLGDDCGYERSGSLVVFDSHEQLEQRRLLDVTQRAARGYAGARFVDAAEVHALEPALAPTIVAGALFEDDAQVEPLPLMEALSRAVHAAGGSVHVGATVSAIARDGANWRVTTTIGDFSAARLVLCAGAWSPSVAELVGLDLPVLPVSGQLLVTEPRKGALRRCVVYQPDPRFDTRLACGVRPATDGRLWLGTTYRAGTFDVTITSEDTRAIHDAFRAVFPALADIAIAEAWAGVRPVPADLLPIYGRIPANEDLFLGVPVAGLAEAAGAGRLLARIVCGEAPESAAYAVARFGTD